MEIKVGQWLRVKNQINKVKDNRDLSLYYGLSQLKEGIKVANTPQELIQVGDLVSAPKFRSQEKRNMFEVCEVLQEKFEGVLYLDINDEYGNDLYDYIETIYTEDNNGNYIKQWEVE